MQNNDLCSAYLTKDTALASYLYALGFELLDTDTSSFPTIFHFKKDGTDIELYARRYRIGNRDEISASAFFRAYKHMLSEIKDSKRKGST